MPVSQPQKRRVQQGGRGPPSLQTAPHELVLTSKPTINTKTPVDSGQQNSQSLMEKQSQKLVQGLITAAIGCITYLRGLIPEKCFCDISYGATEDDLKPQDQILSSQGTNRDRKKKESGTRIKSIQRGISPEADTLLDLVENGIFCALSKGYLKAFQLAIFLDLDHPDLIEEAYTFSVNYHTKEQGSSPCVKDISISTVVQEGAVRDYSTESLDISQINRSVRALIRRLIVVTQNLDLLPEKRYLTIRLYHTADTPGDWTPPMFTLSTGQLFLFGDRVSSSLTDEVFGIVQTGLHSVQVRVTSGKRSLSDLQRAPGLSWDSDSRPLKRQCIGGAVEAHSFISFGPTPGMTAVAKIKCDSGSQTRPCGSHVPDEHDLPIVKELPMVDSKPFLDTPYPRIAYKPSQSITEAPRSISSVLEVEEAQASLKVRRGPKTLVGTGIRLSLRNLKLNEARTSSRARILDADEDRKVECITQIMCECGNDSENLDVIQCNICSRWQHCECYGFIGDKDDRIGRLHACYTCLLGESEPHLLQQMKSFAIARRILRYIIRGRIARTFHNIVKALGIQSSQYTIITGVILVLVQKGYLRAFNSRKIATKRSPDRYNIEETDEALRAVEEDILDPYVNIGHHYNSLQYSSKAGGREYHEFPRQEGDISSRDHTKTQGLRFAPSLGDKGREGTDLACNNGSQRRIGTPSTLAQTSDAISQIKAGNWS